MGGRWRLVLIARMLVYRAAACQMAGLPFIPVNLPNQTCSRGFTYVTQKPSNYMAVWLHKSYPVERLMREANHRNFLKAG